MIVVASILFMVSVGPLIAGAAMLVFDQQLGTHFYDSGQGGDPILWQHLFWFFGHPEVYVVLLPAMGICAEILTCNARKKFFGYKSLIYTVFATGIISFFVWAHHQFVAGIDPRMANVFTITTLIISIPIGEMLFLFIATLAGGQIRLNVPMLWALAFVAEFLLGGVTGIFLGASGSDIYFHDTYFVIAHFHYTFVPIAVIACFAGFTHWIPKMTGRMMNETIASFTSGPPSSASTWCSCRCSSPACGATTPHLQLRALPRADQRRHAGPAHRFDGGPAHHDRRAGLLRVEPALDLEEGPAGRQQPVAGDHLEWTCPSPPPHGNFPTMPTVYRGPYEYSVPGRLPTSSRKISRPPERSLRGPARCRPPCRTPSPSPP